MLRHDGEKTLVLARTALELNVDANAIDEGRAYHAMGDGLELIGDHEGADEAYSKAVNILEDQGRWRDATTACRSWAKMLRELGREQDAMDVLERGTELSMRATPAESQAAR